MNYEAESLRLSLLEFVEQHLATYPLRAGTVCLFKVTASDAMFNVEHLSSHNSSDEEAAIERALKKTPRSGYIADAMRHDAITPAKLKAMRFNQMLKHRNIGINTLCKFARALQAEGIDCVWCGEAIDALEKCTQTPLFRSSTYPDNVQPLLKADWETMRKACSRSSGATVRDQWKILEILKTRKNAPTQPILLFANCESDSAKRGHKTLITVFNRNQERFGSKFRIKTTHNCGSDSFLDFTAQIVVIE